MLGYIVRRLFLIIPTFLLITVISFFIMQMAPGGPLETKLRAGGSGGDSAAAMAVTQEAKEAIRKLYGFDKPIHVRYLEWLGKIVRLDFGESLFEYRPVTEIIWEKLQVAFLFGITSTLVTYFICILLGVFKAIYRDTPFDRISTVFTFTAYSIPSMVVAIVLIVVFSVKLDLLPVVGLHHDDFEDFTTWEYLIDLGKHFVLPFTCYILGSFAFLTELQKKSMLEELKKDYIRTARAKGLSEKDVYFKHAFRNALIPIVTSLRNVLIMFLGASFIIEMIFTIPGLGYLGFTALLNRDYPIIMANLTVTAVLGMISMLITDILYTVVDPRIDFS
jgi:microcin C transport system permease protein